MKNLSKKALLLVGLLLSTIPAKAKDKYDQSSYWFGFTAGAGSTVFALADEGLISSSNAATYMEGILESAETDPDLTEFKQDFYNAVGAIKQNPACKGVIK